MTEPATEKVDLRTMELYIVKHSPNLSVSERQDILRIIINADVLDKYIRTKGNGTEIPLKYVPEETMTTLYKYVKSKITEKQKILNSFPDAT